MNRQERILLWGSNLWYFGAGLLGPLFAVFAGAVGGDVLSITWVWGLYLISMGGFVMIVGSFADRLKHKERLMFAGYLLNALFTFGYLLVDSPEKLLYVQLGLGLATALAAPTWSALYDKYSGDGSRDGWTWGLSSGFEKISTGVAVILGGYIVATYSFDALFIIMGCVQLLACAVQLRLLRSR